MTSDLPSLGFGMAGELGISGGETPVKFLVSPNPKPQPIIAVPQSDDAIISRDPD